MRAHLMAGTALVAATMLAAGRWRPTRDDMKPSISVNGYYEGVVGGIVDDSQETKFTYMEMEGGTDASPNVTAPTDPPMKRDDKKDTSALDTRTDAEIHFNGRPRSTAA